MPRLQLVLDIVTGGVTRGLNEVDSATGRTTRAVAGLREVLVGLGAIRLFFGLAEQFREAERAATEQAQAFAQLEQGVRLMGPAWGKSAEDLADYASHLQAIGTVADEEVIRAQSILLTFTKITSDNFDRATKAVVDLSARMGTDMSSSAIQVGKALGDPKRGLDGLSRSGVVFTEGQKEVIRSMFAAGDAAGAQAKILDELEKEFKDSDKAAREAAGGGLKAWRNAVDDAKEATGADLLAIEDAFARWALGASSSIETVEDSWTKFIHETQANPLLIALRKVADAFRDVGEAVETVTVKQFEQFSEELVESTLAVEGMDQALRRSVLSTRLEEIEGAIESARRRMEDWRKAMEEWREENERFKRSLEQTLDLFEEVAALNNSGQLAQALPNLTLGEAFIGDFDQWAEEMGAELAELESGPGREFSRALGEFVQISLENAFLDALDLWLREGASFAEAFGVLMQGVFEAGGQALGLALSGGNPFAGAIGGIVGGFLGDQIFGGGEPPAVTAFHGAVTIFGKSVETFETSAEVMAQALRVRGEFTDLRRLLGGVPLFDPSQFGKARTGGGAEISGDPTDNFQAFSARSGRSGAFDLTRLLLPEVVFNVGQVQDKWTASIAGLVTGWGDSLEDAMREMFDGFVRQLPDFIESGKVSLEGIPRIFADVLSSGVSQSWEELQDALEVAARVLEAGMGKVRFGLFNQLSSLIVDAQEALRIGVRKADIKAFIISGIEDSLSSLAGVDLFPKFLNLSDVLGDVEQALDALGITGRAAERILEDTALAVGIFNENLRLDVLDRLVNVMERIPGMQEEAMRLQASIDQARFQVELAILEVQLKSFGLWEDFADTMRKAAKFAEDINNFLPEELRGPSSGDQEGGTVTQFGGGGFGSRDSEALDALGDSMDAQTTIAMDTYRAIVSGFENLDQTTGDRQIEGAVADGFTSLDRTFTQGNGQIHADLLRISGALEARPARSAPVT